MSHLTLWCAGTARAVFSLLMVAAAAPPLAAQTLGFDNLAAEPGVAGTSSFVTANGGSRTYSGVTFNAAANADWEIFGNAFRAPLASVNFANSHSGSYVLGGNAFVGSDFSGTVYAGLTLSTTRSLTSLYLGFDDNGGGSHDADSLTIVAFGAGGNLASKTVALTSKTLSFVDTSTTFGSVAGIVGYRFQTTAADSLNAAYGRAYVIADDLSFAVPEPSTTACMALGAAWLAFLRRRQAPGNPLNSHPKEAA